MIKFDSFMNWSTPPEGVILKYAKKCYDFYNDESLFKSFKTDPDYTLILEGSQKSVADIFFGELLSNSRFKEFFIDNLDKIKENDTLGSPILHDYGEYGHLSLGTLKYAWNCSVIKDYFNIDSVSRVVEIGGGYGGMCKTLES